MISKLSIDHIFVYSEKSNTQFHTKFESGTNVIYGRNTSGKSTLIQLILYAFGINDNKIKLTEILSEEIFVRLDCTMSQGLMPGKYVFIRQDETLFIREPIGRVRKFNGISADNSFEHVKLKNYFHKLFDFNLQLESKSGIVKAPIETIFLPYYISQDVGWIYLRKSFSNLNFYKNFKEDFLDYYLGIESVTDRDKKREVENEIKRLQQQISFFIDVERDNEELTVSKVVDDSMNGKANEVVFSLADQKGEILELENKYVKASNDLTFNNQRLNVVAKVSRNHTKQVPGEDNCPTCAQVLPTDLEEVYTFYQVENDTTKLKSELKEKIKAGQTTVNSLGNKIQTLRTNIQKSNSVFSSYAEEGVTFDNWIKNKAKIQLYSDVMQQIGQLTKDLDDKKEELKDFKTDQDIFFARGNKNEIFKTQFLKNNRALNLPELDEDRFNKLYEISSFPFQGVQLHLAVLSYHFAFNKLLTSSGNVHRLPFILDSIFEGDVDGKNKTKILDFIHSNAPSDTQCILSIADSKEKDSKIEEYSKNSLKNEANLICIGQGTDQKAILGEYDSKYDKVLESCYKIMETV